MAIPSAAAAAAAAGRLGIPGLTGAGNSVLLVSNLNPEVSGSLVIFSIQLTLFIFCFLPISDLASLSTIPSPQNLVLKLQMLNFFPPRNGVSKIKVQQLIQKQIRGMEYATLPSTMVAVVCLRSCRPE